MNTVLSNLHILIPLIAAVFILAFLACRTRFSLMFTVIEGCISICVFCFLIYCSASLEELLLSVCVLLLPSLLFKSKKEDSEE